MVVFLKTLFFRSLYLKLTIVSLKSVMRELAMASHMSSAAVEDVERDPVLLRAHGV